MKKYTIFNTLIFLFCSLCFPYICKSSTLSVKVTTDFDENEYPEMKDGHITNAFSFTLEWDTDDLIDNQYYTIDVSLSSSKYKGTAANHGDPVGTDLYFHALDNSEWEVIADAMGLTYEHTSLTPLSDLPTGITVRCRDWGAHGHIIVSIDTTSYYRGTIPIDTNDNDIADGWEKDKGIWIADVTEAKAKAEADDEQVPVPANTHNGDGWSVFDEYRGLYTTKDGNGHPTGHKRLNPKIKDILYSLHTNLSDYGLDQLREIEDHAFTPVILSLVYPYKEDFTEVYEYATDGTPSHLSNDIIKDTNGRINMNSAPVPTDPDTVDKVAGFKPVWAIRIKDGVSNKKLSRIGHATNGSPWKYSLIKVFSDNALKSAESMWNQLANQDIKFKKSYTDKQAKAFQEKGKNRTIAISIAHEIVHDLNIPEHCNHANCLMKASVPLRVFDNRVYYIIKEKLVEDPEPGESDFVDDLDENGLYIPLKAPYLNETHLRHLAVTGAADTSISNCTCVEIDFSELSTISEAPSIGSVTIESDTQIRLTWSAPASDGGSDISDYEYCYQVFGASESGEWTSAGSDLSERISGLTAGTSYTIEVRAKNSIGYSVASESFAFTTSLSPGFSPASGSSYTASAGDTHTGEVRSSEPIYGVGLLVNRNFIKWVWGSETTTSLLMSYTFPEDASGSYTMQAYVFVREGNSYSYLDNYSYVVEVSTQQTVPGVPLSLSAAGSNGAVLLSWLPPLNDGNSPITSYEYRYGIGASVAESDYTVWTSTGGTSLSHTVSSLTNDLYHLFEVRAVNAIGNSDPSIAAGTTPKVPQAPGKPTGLTPTASNGQVTLTWNGSETGGSADTYEYRIDPNNDGTWDEWVSLDSSATSAILTLQNGRNYGIQVRASNSAGSSTQSATVIAMSIDSSVPVPSVPRNLSATPENGQVRLSWNAPSTGTGIIDYESRYDTNDDGSWQAWKITNSTSTSYTVTGLTNDTLYAFMVRARNAGGAGSQSSKVTATPTNITVPTKPQNLTASLMTDGRVFLDWYAPTNNGGSSITDYEYIMDTHDDGSWGSWRTTGDISTDEYLTSFTAGRTYAFRVRAVNIAGAGGASNKATITISAITEPTAPQSFSASSYNASVYLSWSPPQDDGGAAVTYQYRYGISGSSTTYNDWSAEQSNTSVTIYGLTNDTTYEIQLKAKNSAGSSPSVTVTATPRDKTTPGAPQNFDTFAENGAVELWWDEPVDNGGSYITDYEYRYRESSGTWSSWSSVGSVDPQAPAYTITGLTNGTSYDFQLRAENSVGYGPGTSILTETPDAEEPDTPTTLSASTGSTTGSVDLSWSAPNDGGSSITHYEYTYVKYDNGWQGWTSWSSTGSTSTSYTVTGLESGETYRFRVRAVNSVGNSRQSKVAQASAP